MDLNKMQEENFSPMIEGSKEAVLMNESLGMSHAFAKLSEKVELINLMLVPALTSTGMVAGMVAGEVKNMYTGKGTDNDEAKIHLANVIQSVSTIASVLEIELSDIAELAFQEKK